MFGIHIIKSTSEVDEDGYAKSTAADQRHLKMHGSTNERGMAKWSGQSLRIHEKPKGGSPKNKK